jgi:septal ring factor EnvC (AmiA/AmiB activator)
VGAGTGSNIVAGVNNIYVGDSVGDNVPGFQDESNTIRIGDASNGNGGPYSAISVVSSITSSLLTASTLLKLQLDLTNDHLGWDVGPNQQGPQRQAMLNGKVEKLEAKVAQQQKQIETLTVQLREQAESFTAQLKEQATQIQKVSAQFEASKPAPQMVNNP